MGLATNPIMTSIKDEVQSNRRRNRIHREDDKADVTSKCSKLIAAFALKKTMTSRTLNSEAPRKVRLSVPVAISKLSAITATSTTSPRTTSRYMIL